MKEREPTFFDRWSRRKAQARQGTAEAVSPASSGSPVEAPATPETAPPAAASSAEIGSPRPPTMADVARLTRDADYAPFVARGTAPEVRNAALKQLFTDPRFNVMDGLDTYVDDYNKPDPLPQGMLRRMAQAHALGLFDAEREPVDAPILAAADPTTAAPPVAGPEAPSAPAVPNLETDEDPHLQLQPDDDARRDGIEPGAGGHPAGER